MVLKEILEAVERVKEKAEKFRNDLQKSEALTRYALIDPILRALGWDTEEPTQVRPEFSTDSGTPDYALLWDGKPHIMVEAKALGKSLGAAKDKGFQYCWKNKVSYYAITDGSAWELNDLREMGGREILRVQLDQVSPGEAARVLLALWRPAMPSVELPPPPLVKLPQAPLASPKPRQPDSRIDLELVKPPEPLPPSSDRRPTVSLVDLEKEMQSGRRPRRSPPPTRVVFPDRTERDLKRWSDLLRAVVEWRQEKLSPHVPIMWPRSGHSYVGRDNSGMAKPKPVGPYWVETHGDGLHLVKVVCHVLSVLGEDPAAVHVSLR